MPPSGRSSSSHSGPSSHSSSSHYSSGPSSRSSSSHYSSGPGSRSSSSHYSGGPSSHSSSSHYSGGPSSHSYSSHHSGGSGFHGSSSRGSYSSRSSYSSGSRSSTSRQARPHGGYYGHPHYTSTGGYYGSPRPKVRRRRWPIIVIILIVLYIFGSNNNTKQQPSTTISTGNGKTITQTRKTNIELFGREYYVTALGRTCKWNSKYGSYYDEKTDCFFLYNNEIEPAVWQYWYEGISSDYGESGWMEWDESKKQWFIEAKKGQWIPLPDSYSRDGLWHISDK